MEHKDLTCGTCKKFCGNKWCVAYEANRRQAQYVKSISLLVIFMLLLGVVLNTTFDKLTPIVSDTSKNDRSE